MVDTAEGFSASPPLQNGLDAEVHDVQVWGGGGPELHSRHRGVPFETLKDQHVWNLFTTACISRQKRLFT